MISFKLIGQVQGTLNHYENFQSEFVDGRNVDIWLPNGYSETGGKQFPVIYMQDGQNLFNPKTSYSGEEWGVDEAVTKLVKEQKIPEVIVVGIWNTPKRYQEYMPEKPFNKLSRRTKGSLKKKFGGIPVSDEYLKFMVEELKPFIDSVYRTNPDRENTYLMGSSMGGLISIYALCEYPQIFRGAGCLSTHWVGDPEVKPHEVSDAFVTYLNENLPDAGGHILYFDYGTATLDSLYQPHQHKIDKVIMDKSYRVGMDWMTKKYDGHEHNEIYWRKRLDVPLIFLLGD
ncbi:MAG: esterase [Bacteroidetes bacterium 4572_114]|nr:MAG: esterase [Bacteroidetes bacterium 4572_114]